MPQNKLVHQDLLAAGLRQVTGCVSSWDLTEVISAFTFKRLLTSSRWNSAQTILDGLSSQKSHVSHMQRTFLVQRFFFLFLLPFVYSIYYYFGSESWLKSTRSIYIFFFLLLSILVMNVDSKIYIPDPIQFG